MTNPETIDFDKIENPYDTLGIAVDSSTADIRKAYRSLALLYHPDKSLANTADKFLQLQRAYDILNSPILKAELDNYLQRKIKLRASLKEKDQTRKIFAERLIQKEYEHLQNKRDAVYKPKKFSFYNFRRENNLDDYSTNNVERLEKREEQRRVEIENKLSSLIFSIVHQKFIYTVDLLKAFFSKFGSIAEITYDKQQKAGIIRYKTIKAAEKAFLYLNDFEGFLNVEYLVNEEREARKTGLKSSIKIENELTSDKLFAYAVNVNELNYNNKQVKQNKPI